MMHGTAAKCVLTALTGIVYLFLFGPLIVTVMFAFSNSQFPTFPITDVSFRWFTALYDNAATLKALRVSLILGGAVALAALLVGVPAALAVSRYEFRGKTAVRMLLLSPILIPEVVLAVGLLLLMKGLGQPRSMATLFIGHVILAAPFVVLVAQARLTGVLPVYEEAARSLGANRFHTFREVTLPLMMPAIFAGGLLAFVISFDNITATMFWRPGGMETVPTLIYAMLRDSISPEINALGTLVVALTVGIPIIGGQIIRRLR
jgi:spermidine/putrescine transport system permease protein